jgi:hypothetical protein
VGEEKKKRRKEGWGMGDFERLFFTWRRELLDSIFSVQFGLRSLDRMTGWTGWRRDERPGRDVSVRSFADWLP